MKIINVFGCLLISFTFIQCSKSESPDPGPDNNNRETEEAYLTVNVYENYHAEDSDDWIIVHDENGNLLDYKPFENGDMLTFAAPPSQLTPKLNVTRLRVNTTDQSTTHEFNTDTQIAKGTIMDLGTPTVPAPAERVPLDDFKVTISNIPEPKQVMISYEGSTSLSSSGTGYNGLWTYELNVPHFEGYDEYVIDIIDGYDRYRQYHFNNPAGDDLVLDYISQFQDYDQVLELTLPPHQNFNVHIAGFHEEQEITQWGGIWLEDHIYGAVTDVNTDPLPLVYLNEFDKFATYFNIRFTDYLYHKSEFGSPFQTLEIPDKPSFTVEDPSLENFSYNTDMEHIFARWRFYYNAGSYENSDYTFTRWFIKAEEGYNPVLGEVPEEILSMYPLMDPEGMSFDEITLYKKRTDAPAWSYEFVTLFF